MSKQLDQQTVTSHLIHCQGVENLEGYTGMGETPKKNALEPRERVCAIINIMRDGSTQVICPLLFRDEDDPYLKICSAPLQKEPDLLGSKDAYSDYVGSCPYVKSIND